MAKTKKYAGLVGVVPKGNPGPTDESGDPVEAELAGKFELAVREERTKLVGKTLPEVVAAYVEARDEKDALNLLLTECNAKVEAYRRAVCDGMEEAGIAAVTLETGESLDSSPEPYAQVTDRDALRQWAIDNGYMNSLQLPWQTLNAIVKDKLLAGEPEPPGVTAFLKTKLRLRRS